MESKSDDAKPEWVLVNYLIRSSFTRLLLLLPVHIPVSLWFQVGLLHTGNSLLFLDFFILYFTVDP